MPATEQPREVELPAVAERDLSEQLGAPLAVLADGEARWEDRAAVYQALHQLQLIINRALRKAKPAVVYALDQAGIERAGRLRLKWKPKAVEWPCNEPPAWTDPDVQGALEELLRDPMGRHFVRAIPEHLELDTALLGTAMMSPSSIDSKLGPEALQEYARALWRQAVKHHWRVERHPEPNLEVEALKSAKR